MKYDEEEEILKTATFNQMYKSSFSTGDDVPPIVPIIIKKFQLLIGSLL